MLIQGNYSVIVNLFGIKKSDCACGFLTENNKANAAIGTQVTWHRYEPAGISCIFEQFFCAHDMRACGKQDHGLVIHDAASLAMQRTASAAVLISSGLVNTPGEKRMEP
jgi:hypothetical protein